jgi:hypothetical protein
VRLVVPNIEPRVFQSYYYGAGEIISVEQGSRPNTSTFIIDYGSDASAARHQEARLASGLYFSSLESN